MAQLMESTGRRLLPTRWHAHAHAHAAGGLLGRDAELDVLLSAVHAAPAAIVSVSGVHGSGRSSLVAEACRRVTEAGTDDVVWLDGGQRRGPLADELAAHLGLTELDPRAVTLVLQGRRALIVVDDGDDVRDEVEAIADALSPTTARLVVTSVRPLRSARVTNIRLRGLPVPSERARDAIELLDSAAVQLYLRTADDARVASDDAALQQVAQVCRALEGLPLAVVLTAARLARPGARRAWPPGDLDDDRLFGLALTAPDPTGATGRGRDTLRDVLSWSTSLLTPTGQRVLRDLSVFPATFDLAAAESVCALPRDGIVEAVDELVDCCLVEPASPHFVGDSFRLTPLIRAFASRKSHEMGEAEAVAARHATHYARLARDAARAFDDARERDALQMLAGTEADFAAALALLSAADEPVAALRLVADLGPVADANGTQLHLVERLDTLMARCGDRDDVALQADARLWASDLGASTMAAPDTVALRRRQWQEGMALARTAGEPTRVLRGLATAILTLPVTHDFEAATAAAEAGRILAADIGHVRWLARFTGWSGMVAHQMRDYTGAAQFATDALAIAVRASDRRALLIVGLLVHSLPERAAPHLPMLPPLEELYGIAVQLGDRNMQAYVLGHLASNANRRRDFDAAAKWTRLHLELVYASKAWHGVAFSLMNAVVIAVGRGELALAARSQGALEAMLPTLLAGVSPRDARSYEVVLATLRAELGEHDYEEELRAGSLIPWQEAVDAVLPLLASGPAPPETPPAGPVLTRRERDVLGLLVQGLTNKEIARSLGILPKTVMHYSGAIYRKLGVRGRTDAAALAVRRGLVDTADPVTPPSPPR